MRHTPHAIAASAARTAASEANVSGRPAQFEVHEHCYVSGPRANGAYYKFSHSHEGGDQPHQHPNTGPASYTIDKDEWFRATGLRGGGLKKFTTRPTGEQLPWQELEAWQKTFEVVIHGDPTPELGEGPGIAPAVRMVKQFRMRIADVRDERRGR